MGQLLEKEMATHSSILFFFFFFTLQHCIGFAIHQHASTMGVHVFLSWNPLPPPSPYHPYGSSQCTSPKPPVSCIEPGLTIRFLYDIIHVLMPFSQIIPRPIPSPTEPKRLFYTSVSLSHSSILSWNIPWTEEPGRLQSMWSQRVGHDWVTSLSLFHLSLKVFTSVF